MAKYANIHGEKKIQPGNEQIKYQQVIKNLSSSKRKSWTYDSSLRYQSNFQLKMHLQTSMTKD